MGGNDAQCLTLELPIKTKGGGREREWMRRYQGKRPVENRSYNFRVARLTTRGRKHWAGRWLRVRRWWPSKRSRETGNKSGSWAIAHSFKQTHKCLVDKIPTGSSPRARSCSGMRTLLRYHTKRNEALPERRKNFHWINCKIPSRFPCWCTSMVLVQAGLSCLTGQFSNMSITCLR